MRLAPVNPADLLALDGKYAFPLALGAVLGAEGVGEVTACGDGCSRLATGDHVIPLTRGNWCTSRTLPETELVRVSATLPLETAARLRVNTATAWRLLGLGDLQAGDWVIQNGAGSQVANWLRHFARQRGIHVANVARRIPVGADGVWLAQGADLRQRIAEVSGGAECHLALDCVAGAETGRLAECLSPGGTLAVFGHLSGEPCQVPSQYLTGKALKIVGFSLRAAEAGEPIESLQALYDQLSQHAEGQVLPVPTFRFALRNLGAAIAWARDARGTRILLELGDD